MDQAESSSIVPGVPNSALFVGAPLLGNFATVTWYTGYCRALGIPLWYVSVNSVQVFIVGLFSLPVAWAFLMLYLMLRRRGITKHFDTNALVRGRWFGGIAFVLLALAFAWGYALPFFTKQWSVVAGAPECVILIRTGDSVIAGEYDTSSRRLRGRITLYPIDAVPTIDVYRVALDVRGGTAPVPSERPSTCPKGKKP